MRRETYVNSEKKKDKKVNESSQAEYEIEEA